MTCVWEAVIIIIIIITIIILAKSSATAMWPLTVRQKCILTQRKRDGISLAYLTTWRLPTSFLQTPTERLYRRLCATMTELTALMWAAPAHGRTSMLTPWFPQELVSSCRPTTQLCTSAPHSMRQSKIWWLQRSTSRPLMWMTLRLHPTRDGTSWATHGSASSITTTSTSQVRLPYGIHTTRLT